jgi:hypothetical protein
MNKSEIYKWHNGEYPYDYAKCGNCATQHKFSYFMGGCAVPEHAGMREDSEKLRNKLDDGFRKSVLAFRKKWAKYYPA